MTDKKSTSTSRAAGAFDIRNVVALLLGFYGIVLVVCAFTVNPGYNPDASVQKDAMDNLWTGIGLLVVTAIFFAWAKIRPIVLDVHNESEA